MCAYLKLHVNRVLEKAKFPVAFLINTFLEKAACYLVRGPGEDILSHSRLFHLYSLCSVWNSLTFNSQEWQGKVQLEVLICITILFKIRWRTESQKGTFYGLFSGMTFSATFMPMAIGMWGEGVRRPLSKAIVLISALLLFACPFIWTLLSTDIQYTHSGLSLE